MRVVIVGGGILGLAAARLAAREHPGAAVVVLEREAAVALHQTGRNSGVVHAGLYYEPGSLKARLCRRGAELLRAFCAERGVPYEACGKLVVATRAAELGRLEALAARAEANGVPGLRRLDAAGLRAIEPCARGLAALHSPATAITDFRRVALALAEELGERGGELRLGTDVERVDAARGPGDGIVVRLAGGAELRADRAIVCAGLHADRLAVRSGQPAEPWIVPVRGEYWALRPERRALVRGLIYPVPDPALPFLGIHLTRTLDGGVLLGPNAVPVLARRSFAWPGTWRLMRRHWRAGAGELARTASKAAFVREARRFVPELRARDAVRAQAGVRAQALDRDGALVDDFRIGGDARVVWVRNAPSPAATSALAIAEELVGRLRLS
jgi:L-2-hydroxyglutarate oxidase LhgO